LKGSYLEALAEASPDDALLILSLLVWPEEYPDPGLLAEWLRTRSDQDGVSL